MTVNYDGDVASAEQAVTDALKAVGFGVLTRIDVAETLKKKLGLERRPYVILGACNPKIASRALETEEELGLLLPCNVIVYQDADGQTKVSAIDPAAMLSVVRNTDLDPVADEVGSLLRQALETVAA
ncbi:MAG: DUF302 domain-containing protein [Zetaproteobacteria bacterium]|nr:MAG: DUF302 domain-containing protein [Zetaproteobacteria bacterium]